MYSGYGWSSLGRDVFRVWPILTGSVCIQGVACLHWACMYSEYGLSSLGLYVFRVWPVFTVPVYVQGMACLHCACMYSGYGLSSLCLYVFRVWPVCIQGVTCMYLGYGLSSLGLQQGSPGRGEAAGGEQRLSQPHGVQGGQVSTSL